MTRKTSLGPVRLPPKWTAKLLPWMSGFTFCLGVINVSMGDWGSGLFALGSSIIGAAFHGNLIDDLYRRLGG